MNMQFDWLKMYEILKKTYQLLIFSVCAQTALAAEALQLGALERGEHGNLNLFATKCDLQKLDL